MSDLRVWECRIVVDGPIPSGGFDSVPRMAAENAIREHGVNVIANASGWGARPTAEEIREFSRPEPSEPLDPPDGRFQNLTDDEILLENLRDV